MFAYLLLALSPLILATMLPYYKEEKAQKRKYYIILGIIFVFIIGFRSIDLGSTDTYVYTKQFLNAGSYDNLSDYLSIRNVTEIGYNTFEWILARLFGKPVYLIVVTSIIYVLSVFGFAKKNSTSPAYSIFLYVTIALLLFNMQGMRQSLAMSICIFSYEYVKKRKPIKFFILVALAFFFHRTAIVFAIIYFLYGQKLTKKRALLYVPISAIVLLLSNQIIDFANKVFTFGGIERTYTGIASGGGYVTLFLHILILVVAILGSKNDNDNDNEYSLLFYMSLLCTISFLMRYFGAYEAERISFYFAYAEIALLPNSIERLKPSNRVIVQVGFFVIAMAIFISKLINNNFLPYSFFWNS